MLSQIAIEAKTLPVLLIEQRVLDSNGGSIALFVAIIGRERRRYVRDGNAWVAAVAANVGVSTKRSRRGLRVVGLCRESWDARGLVHGLAEEPHRLSPHSELDTSGIEEIGHVGVGDGSDGSSHRDEAGASEEALQS